MRSVKGIYVAVGVLVLSMGVGAYVDIENDAMHARLLTINTGVERMVRLNQELNTMLVTAVLEQNTLRTASYDTVNADLEATIQTVSHETHQQNLAEEIAALSEDRNLLHVTEESALMLMRLDRWEDAHQMLFAESYVMAKKMYEINSETVVGALTGELGTTAEHFGRIRAAASAMRLAALLLLLWVGVMFSRRMNTEQAAQDRLRDEITTANQLLEEKVRLRTAELEAANLRLEILSTTDSLTGLANRRSFDLAWEVEWQRANRQGLPLAMAMVDVDQFKVYNDHYGHQAGDLCLKAVADTLRGAVQRSGELVARYGGEEFVVILPGLSGAEACAVMEKIRATLQLQRWPHAKATASGIVTISVGVASCVPQLGQRPAGLLQAADAAMYRAKAQGRNQVVLAA